MPRILPLFLLVFLSGSFAADPRWTSEHEPNPLFWSYVTNQPMVLPGGGPVILGQAPPAALVMKPTSDGRWLRGELELSAIPPYSEPDRVYFFSKNDPEKQLEKKEPIEAIVWLGSHCEMLRAGGGPAVGVVQVTAAAGSVEGHLLRSTPFEGLLKSEFSSDNTLRLAPGSPELWGVPVSDGRTLVIQLQDQFAVFLQQRAATIRTALEREVGPDWPGFSALIDQELAKVLGSASGTAPWLAEIALPVVREQLAAGEPADSPTRLLRDALLDVLAGPGELKADEIRVVWETVEDARAHPQPGPLETGVRSLLLQSMRRDDEYHSSRRELLSLSSWGGPNSMISRLNQARVIDADPAASDAQRMELNRAIADAHPNAAVSAELARINPLGWTRPLTAAQRTELARRYRSVFPTPTEMVAKRLEMACPEGSLQERLQAIAFHSPESWLAGRSTQYPAGDPAFSLLAEAEVLVDPEAESEKAVRIFNECVIALAATPMAKDALGVLVEKVPLRVAMAYLAKAGDTAPGGLRGVLNARLEVMQLAAEREGSWATVAGLAVLRAQAQGLPQPTNALALADLPAEAPSELWERARFYVGRLFFRSWPALNPHDPESALVYRILTEDRRLAASPARMKLGLVTGPLETLGATVRAQQAAEQPWLRLSRELHAFVPAGNETVALWTVDDAPEIQGKLKEIESYRDSIMKAADGVPAFLKRWYNTDALEAELAALRGESGTVSSQLNARRDQVARAEAEYGRAQANRSKMERDGVYLSRHPTRSDTVITREMNAMERGAVDSAISSQANRVDSERNFANYLAQKEAAYSARERELVAEINQFRMITDDRAQEREIVARDAPRLEAALRQLETLRQKYATVPENGAKAVRNTIREAALSDYRDRAIQRMNGAITQGSPEAEWTRWWLLGSTILAKPQIAGVPLPQLASIPELVYPSFEYELERIATIKDHSEAKDQFLLAAMMLADQTPADTRRTELLQRGFRALLKQTSRHQLDMLFLSADKRASIETYNAFVDAFDAVVKDKP